MHKNQKGFAHIGLLLLVVLVIAAVGGVGYYVSKQDKNTPSQTTTTTAVSDLHYVSDKTINEYEKQIDSAGSVQELSDVLDKFAKEEYPGNWLGLSVSKDNSGVVVNGRNLLDDVLAKYEFATEQDLPNLKKFSKVFTEEVTKFPDATTGSLDNLSLIAVKNLQDSVDASSNAGGTSARGFAKFILYDFNNLSDLAFTRHAVQHEFGHLLDQNGLLGGIEVQDENGNDTVWSKLNTSGFTYGHPDQRDTEGNWLAHPKAGFVSNYAQTSAKEDKAETLATMMTKNGRQKLNEWIKTDPVLKKKVDYLIAALDKSAPGFDSQLADRANRY